MLFENSGKLGASVLSKRNQVLWNKLIHRYIGLLRILIIGLQKGDEVVMINGTHVEGMTSTEVVNTIKGIDGDVNVVAKRGDATPIVRATGAVAPPGIGEWFISIQH